MTKNVNVRFPDDVHRAAAAAAAADDRSLNSWLVAVVRRAAEAQKEAERTRPLRGSDTGMG